MRCFVEGEYNFTRPPRDDVERARGPYVVGCSACEAEFFFDQLVDGGIPPHDGDGREIGREPALCWKIDEAIFVHPDRWQTFIDCIVRAGGKIITTKPGDPS